MSRYDGRANLPEIPDVIQGITIQNYQIGTFSTLDSAYGVSKSERSGRLRRCGSESLK